MSNSFQKFFCMGNLTKEPVIKATTGGTTACEFTVAVNGIKQDEPPFYANCVVFGKTGENCGKYLVKGSPVLIEGRLRTDKWTDKQTGQDKHKTVVVVSSVQFLGDGNRKNGGQVQTQNEAPAQMKTYAPPVFKQAGQVQPPAPIPQPEPVGVADEDIPF